MIIMRSFALYTLSATTIPKKVMPKNDRWNHMSVSDWQSFAQEWLEDQRNSVDLDAESDIGQAVVLMNFTASADQQWQFILAAVAESISDNDLGEIAAGPIEHLLAWHGEEWIDRVEQQAANDEKFARALTGVWRHKMAAHVWKRVQHLQSQVQRPLE